MVNDIEIPWGPSGLDVYNRTYSRPKPDGTKEVWPETVERVAMGNLSLVRKGEVLSPEEHDERAELIRLMEDFAILPAGRHLWATGVKGRSFLFNCWHSGWGDLVSSHFKFSFMRLMEGGGVGATYSTSTLIKYGPVRQGVSVHIVCDEEHQDYEAMKEAGLLSSDYCPDYQGNYFEVEDSREGWASALVDLLEAAWNENTSPVRVYDVSRVRHAGSRLKTFGGHASGPAPLAQMLRDVGETLANLHDYDKGDPYEFPNLLDPISAMEIDHAIAQCVVAGGNRRSARMSIMPWDDPYITEFIKLKEDTDKHWTTNISVQVDNEFFKHLNDHELSVGGVLAHDVLEMVSEGMLRNGEPGIWNKSYSNVGEVHEVSSTNPCLTGDTVIATVDGPRTFADLAEVGEDVLVYSWHPETKKPVIRWMRNPHKTGWDEEILKVTFDSGLTVRCTPDHGFYSFRGDKVEARDMRIGQSIRAFSASRDSSGHERVHGWDSERNGADHQWTHRMLWENFLGIDQLPYGVNVAHLDGDGTNNSMDNLAVMTELGHRRYDMPKRQLAGMDGHSPNHKVVAIENAGREDVYNGMVEDSHTYVILDHDPIAGHMSGIISANCGEIPLPEWGACVLGHVNLDAFAPKEPGDSFDIDGAVEAARLMTRFLIRATFGDIGDDTAREVMDRDRRIGVGLLGFQAAFAKLGIPFSEIPDSPVAAFILSVLSKAVRNEARAYAFELRIPEPIKVTTIAPTGTIAKLPGTTEGIHPIFARHFIRRIRFSTLDPDQVARLEQYRADGFHVEPCLYAENTMVVEIPTREKLVDEVEALGYDPIIVQSADELNLAEMLRVQEFVQEVYADNAISFTANVDPEKYDKVDVYALLKQYGPRLKGSTIFPDQSRPQSPYERISEADFNLYKAIEVGEGVDEACASGACSVR